MGPSTFPASPQLIQNSGRGWQHRQGWCSGGHSKSRRTSLTRTHSTSTQANAKCCTQHNRKYLPKLVTSWPASSSTQQPSRVCKRCVAQQWACTANQANSTEQFQAQQHPEAGEVYSPLLWDFAGGKHPVCGCPLQLLCHTKASPRRPTQS